MRHPMIALLCLGTAVALSACNRADTDAEVKRAMKDLNVIDDSNMSEIMLTVADPVESVSYFKRTLAANPDRIDLKRGLAQSLVRAKKNEEGKVAWQAVVASADSTSDDKVELADAMIRVNDWTGAEAVLNTIPPTHETFKRYRLEAMVADSQKKWSKADSFYETAVGLTTTPATTYNNWGFSKLSRGEAAGAEKLFNQALTYDRTLFTAKNNLVLSRAAQHKYDMPVVDMTQSERAQLLYTAALAAIKQGDVTIGKGLLKDAIDTNPEHFDAAVRSLDALEGKTSG